MGGALEDNAANYGLAIGAVPSKRAPETVDQLLELYSAERVDGESFRGWVVRVGKKSIKERLQDLMVVPSHDDDASFYVDWHDAREYSIGDIGVGECAGEVVSLTQFSLAEAESQVFDASVLFSQRVFQKISLPLKNARCTPAFRAASTFARCPADQYSSCPTDMNILWLRISAPFRSLSTPVE